MSETLRIYALPEDPCRVNQQSQYIMFPIRTQFTSQGVTYEQ